MLLDDIPEGMPHSLEKLWLGCTLQFPEQRWHTGQALAWVQGHIARLTGGQ